MKIAIAGMGPAGLEATLHFYHLGAEIKVFDNQGFGGSLLNFPSDFFMEGTWNEITSESGRNISSLKVDFNHRPTITDYLSQHTGLSVLYMIILFVLSFVTYSINIYIFFVVLAILACYMLLFAVALLRRGLRYLLNNDGNIYQLISGYALAVLGILFLFTALYSATETFDVGYITYGKCSVGAIDGVNRIDPNIVHTVSGRFYFSAVTFFTIGYGDICPMGWDKGIAILNGFMGTVFATIVLGIAIAKYIDYERVKHKKKDDYDDDQE